MHHVLLYDDALPRPVTVIPDANMFLAELGPRSRGGFVGLIEQVAAAGLVATSPQIIAEVGRHITTVGDRHGRSVAMRELWLEKYLPNLVIVELEHGFYLDPRVQEVRAEDPDDVHVAALALQLGTSSVIATRDGDLMRPGFAAKDHHGVIAGAARVARCDAAVVTSVQLTRLAGELVGMVVGRARAGSPAASAVLALVAAVVFWVMTNDRQRDRTQRRVRTVVEAGLRVAADRATAGELLNRSSCYSLAGPSPDTSPPRRGCSDRRF